MGLHDVHAHLTHPRFPDLDAAIARAHAAGVTSIVCNGLHPDDNAAVAALAARCPIVRPAFGFYPVDTVLPEMVARGIDYPREGARLVSADEGVAWVAEHVHGAFAVGEIGLDGHWVPPDLWPAQDAVARRLVDIARSADKPIICHSRKREEALFALLLERGARRVNWHCFGGRLGLARRIAEAGHWLSLPANLHRSQSFQRIAEVLPRDRILLETDCPYLSPEPGTPSEPAHVARTAATLAGIWRLPLEETHAQLARNFEALFGVAA
jgi:TatD DNase family protein